MSEAIAQLPWIGLHHSIQQLQIFLVCSGWTSGTPPVVQTHVTLSSPPPTSSTHRTKPDSKDSCDAFGACPFATHQYDGGPDPRMSWTISRARNFLELSAFLKCQSDDPHALSHGPPLRIPSTILSPQHRRGGARKYFGPLSSTVTGHSSRGRVTGNFRTRGRGGTMNPRLRQWKTRASSLRWSW